MPANDRPDCYSRAKASAAPGNGVTKFVVDAVYTDRAAGDHELIYRWKVVARTAKTLTLRNMNRTVEETFKRGVRVYEGIERCSPNGRYSMAPVISADQRGED